MTSLRPLGLSIACCVIALACSARSRAQTNSDLTLGEYESGFWGVTLDQPLYQQQGHVKGVSPGSGRTAQLFWWDSTGRFRLSTTDPDAPTLGYRYLTVNFDTNSPLLPDTLDELSLAGGVHLGKLAGGDLGLVGGLGYSGDNLFADANGIFGIAHLTWRKPITPSDALALTLDYDGNSSFLPDVPLPGFRWQHTGEQLSYAVGFPSSSVEWHIAPPLTLVARYEVPYNADVSLDYSVTKHWGAFVGFSNFLNGFNLDDEPATVRIFQQMRRVQAGVRYKNPDFVMKGAYVDIGLVVGYAFDQQYSHGFDVRDLDPFATISDEPYIGIVLRGRF